MYSTTRKNRLGKVISYAATVAFLSAASVCAVAQTSAPAADDKPVDLKKSLMAPIDLTRPADLTYSSSAAGSDEMASAENFMPRPSEDQPPPRRRYGRRTNYSDRWHHADGSNKYTFAAGGAFSLPTGSSGKELDLSWKFQVAGGYNFNKKFAILFQYDYDKFGLTGGNLDRQYLRYTALGLTDDTGAPISFAGLDGNAHMWSLTLNPMYTYYQGDALGAYVIGGGGFYRKVTNFTLPQTGVYCDFFGFCYQFTQNQTFDHYSNNAGGVNGGIGFTYRLSRFASQKLYAEARYVWVDNQPSANSSNPDALYPENNKRTGYFPITVGLRW